MKTDKSEQLFIRAKKFIPGGVNSPVRAFKSVGGNPIFFASGNGSTLTDVDGNEYIDYIGSWGPHLFGHNPPFITEALKTQLASGISYGAPAAAEAEMAELITELVPSVEMVRMVNSGTEATMSAVRVARGYTGKTKIIKFEGCYHGHADFFLIKAGSGALTFGVPTSPGVTEGNAADTLIADFNNIESVEKLFKEHRGNIAAVIIEPIAGNMGVVKAETEFLIRLRELCTEDNTVLIFDEVMTGFRVARGGAQEVLGVKPDLSTFGKIIGGGLPVGAFGGKAEIMSVLSPSGPVYQAGTLSGNPLAMAAGIAALRQIRSNAGLYAELEEKSNILQTGFEEEIRKAGVPASVNRVGSMMTLFFSAETVRDYKTAVKSDTAAFAKYFHLMLERGVYLPPAQFEALFVSTVHTEEQIHSTITAHAESLRLFK